MGSGRVQLPLLLDIVPPGTSRVPHHRLCSCAAVPCLVVSTTKHALITCSRRQNERELALNYTKFICFGGGEMFVLFRNVRYRERTALRRRVMVLPGDESICSGFYSHAFVCPLWFPVENVGL